MRGCDAACLCTHEALLHQLGDADAGKRPAIYRFDSALIDTLGQSQAHEQGFRLLLIRLDQLPFCDAIACACHLAQPTLGLAFCFGRDAISRQRQTPVRTGANTDIIAIAPIDKVVAGFFSGLCVV